MDLDKLVWEVRRNATNSILADDEQSHQHLQEEVRRRGAHSLEDAVDKYCKTWSTRIEQAKERLPHVDTFLDQLKGLSRVHPMDLAKFYGNFGEQKLSDNILGLADHVHEACDMSKHEEGEECIPFSLTVHTNVFSALYLFAQHELSATNLRMSAISNPPRTNVYMACCIEPMVIDDNEDVMSVRARLEDTGRINLRFHEVAWLLSHHPALMRDKDGKPKRGIAVLGSNYCANLANESSVVIFQLTAQGHTVPVEKSLEESLAGYTVYTAESIIDGLGVTPKVAQSNVSEFTDEEAEQEASKKEQVPAGTH